MTALSSLLDIYRAASASEREKGTYFEELICAYLRNEAIHPSAAGAASIHIALRASHYLAAESGGGWEPSRFSYQNC